MGGVSDREAGLMRLVLYIMMYMKGSFVLHSNHKTTKADSSHLLFVNFL